MLSSESHSTFRRRFWSSSSSTALSSSDGLALPRGFHMDTDGLVRFGDQPQEGRPS